ncbi:MAG: SPASM domain-containing protein, partial [Planctomycetota bacterium]
EPEEYENLLNDLLQIKQNSKIQVRVTCGPQFARLHRQKGEKELTEDVSGCMAGRGFGFISYRGDVQTCGFLDISAGNLVENNFNFAEIWLQSNFLNKIRNYKAYKGNCSICQYLKICGGCRARALAMAGDYLATDPVCSYLPEEKK